MNTTGDGFLAMFAGALGAIRCAASIREATDRLGLPVRIGVHTGEVELLPGDIGGVAVHAAARVMALGGASEVMVSSSTRGLLAEGDLRFESRGVQSLKGLPAPIEVFAPRLTRDSGGGRLPGATLSARRSGSPPGISRRSGGSFPSRRRGRRKTG